MKVDGEKLAKIEAALKKTGYILEREVADLLETFKWSVISNRYYIDSITKAPRELDILAYKTFIHMEIRHYFVLIISCKKSESKDWIFLTKPTRVTDPNFVAVPQLIWTNSAILKVTGTIEKVQDAIIEKSKIDSEFSDIFGIESNVYAFQEVSIGSSKPQNDKPIYSSIDSLLMAANYELMSIREKKKEDVVYHFNMLTVFEGEMYEALITGDQPKVRSIDHAKYVNRFIVNNDDSFYRLHFCTKTKLPEILYEFDRLYEFEQEKITENIEEFVSSFLENDLYRNAFREEICNALSSYFTYLLQDFTNSEKTKIDDIWLENEQDPVALAIEIYTSQDVIDVFNESKLLTIKTQDALKHYCRYEGPFTYKVLKYNDELF